MTTYRAINPRWRQHFVRFQEIAAFVLQLRKTQDAYPIYITELTLSRQFFGQSTIDILQTLHFLQYKKWIEDKLNKALDGLKER